jgi:RNA polymerase sigma-70 factor (ECF subfamily)
MSDHAQALCERAKQGDMSAASELVARFYERIFAYFRRLCGNDEDAADLTQKTFFKVWVSLASFQNRSSFSTWLHGIAHHVYVDWRRKKNPLQAQADEWWEACAADGPNPFEDAAEKEAAKQIYSLVERLEDGVRQAVHLHYYQGLSISETAEALNIATSTVKYRLREALDFLRSKTVEPQFRKA